LSAKNSRNKQLIFCINDFGGGLGIKRLEYELIESLPKQESTP